MQHRNEPQIIQYVQLVVNSNWRTRDVNSLQRDVNFSSWLSCPLVVRNPFPIIVSLMIQIDGFVD
jgi:hypothetical protein